MKLKVVIVVLILVVLAGVGAYAYYSGMLDSLIHQGPAAANAPANDLPKVFGTLTAVTPTSITVTNPDGKATTLTVNAQTQVITQVEAGETGKTLEQLPLQSQVLVVPDAANATVAAYISPLPMPPVPPQGGAMMTSADGTILSKTASSLTIQKDDNTSVKVKVDASTKVLSNVAAGEKGAGFGSLAVGDHIGVVGTLNADASITALQLLIQRPAVATTSAAQ